MGFFTFSPGHLFTLPPQLKTAHMRAILVPEPGPPEVLQLKDIPTPTVRPGWVLVRVKAFGLNRSEMFTRQGHSGAAVKFPRVLGIECVGEIEDPSDSKFRRGQTVAAVMGGMGRQFDGGYAEYCLLPTTQVMPVETNLAWDKFAAVPETYLTAWGCLVDAIGVTSDNTLLIRGGTSSVGMAAIALGKSLGCTVAATTRNPSKRDALMHAGAQHAILDSGTIASEVKQIFANGVNGVLELIGTGTLLDSLQCAAPKGVVCFAGMLGGQWSLEHFEPIVAIPSTVKLTGYTTHIVTAANSTAALQHIVRDVEAGRLPLNLDRVFRFDEIVEAHRYMEDNRAVGKLVVTLD
jgi:NADPH:quinone reductase-like Zn-dependent oxidoreductase